MTKAHLISTATALTLGYGAGFASDGLVAATSVPQKLSAHVEKTLPADNPVLDGIRTNASNAMCADAEAKTELDAGDCAKRNVRCLEICYYDAENKANVRVAYEWDGTLTLGDPQ